jgi:hypothetical protein
VLTRKNLQCEDIKPIPHKPLNSLQKNSFISFVQLLTFAFGGQCSIQLSYECLAAALATDPSLRHPYFADASLTG